VLVAEDNKVNRFILAQFLQKWGARFDLAEDGTQAVALAERNDYHAVLLDLQMPGLDGFEAAKRMRNLPGDRYRSCPSWPSRGEPGPAWRESLAAAGITDFVGKPLSRANCWPKLPPTPATDPGRRRRIMGRKRSSNRSRPGPWPRPPPTAHPLR
jgi:CheY-like chemotaxis protein